VRSEEPAPNPWFVENWPEVHLSMGLTAERAAPQVNRVREDSDAFALRSHLIVVRAQANGHFADEIVPIEAEHVSPGKVERSVFDRDEGSRADRSREVLGKLKLIDGRELVANQRRGGGAGGHVGSQGAAIGAAADGALRELRRVPPEIMGIGRFQECWPGRSSNCTIST
jgi:acetyl-CoA acyltransferase